MNVVVGQLTAAGVMDAVRAAAADSSQAQFVRGATAGERHVGQLPGLGVVSVLRQVAPWTVTA